jgi:hypothetical protein
VIHHPWKAASCLMPNIVASPLPAPFSLLPLSAVMFNHPLHSARWDGGIWGPPFPTKRKECQLFAEGRCQNGPKCPFLHRIAIKRPVGHCGDEANDSTGPPQQTHDNPSVGSKAGPRESAVSRLNTAQKCLDPRGGLQATEWVGCGLLL